MIRVERVQDDENGQRVEPPDTWRTAAAAKTNEAVTEGSTHNVTDLYKDDSVRAALEKLFSDKCAYCETKGVAGFDWDVEHFRPKGRVAEVETHPGYYWLAYTWTNLYLSCTYCNQRRRDKPRWDNPVTGASAGKLDQFPVDPETSRVDDPDASLVTEGRLLLDPCADTPEDHLSFDPVGQAIPRNGSAMADTSIRVFALNRKRLRDARAAKIQQVRTFIDTHVGLGNDPQTSTNATLLVLSESGMEYAGVARAIARDPAAFGF